MPSTLCQQQAPATGPQMQVPLQRRPHIGLPTMNDSRPGPLPADHPLRREMDELKATRKKRQLYWAGLIEDLGDDEWGNPANYDRQRWEDEERLADKKFEELAGQIKLAEMGFTPLPDEVREHGRRTSAALDQGNTAEYNRRRYSDGRATTSTRHRARQDSNPTRYQNRRKRLVSDFRGRNPYAPPRKEIVWTQRKRASAVSRWMHDMGMNNTKESSSMEHQDMVGGAMFLGDHDAKINEISQQDGELNGLRTIDNSDERHKVGKHHDTVRPRWTVLDELAFEEAEREREQERLLLGRLVEEDRGGRSTVQRDAGSALASSRTALPTVQSERAVPRKETHFSMSDSDMMSVLLRSLSGQGVGSHTVTQQDPLTCPGAMGMNGETSSPTLSVVLAKQVSDPTSMQRQSSIRPLTDLSSITTSDISPKVTTQVASGAVLEPPPAPLDLDATHQYSTIAKIAADLTGCEKENIDKLDMGNVIGSDDDDTSLHPEPYSDADDEDSFMHIDDTPHLPSPVPPDNAASTNQPSRSSQNNTTHKFSALGLHYRNTLKVNEMFSPTGTLVPPEPGSVAARFRDIRGPFEEYSDLIRRWAVAGEDKDESEGRIVVEGVSEWVDVRAWLVDWRDRLDM